MQNEIQDRIQLSRHLSAYMIIAGVALVAMMVLNTLSGYSLLGFSGVWYQLDLRIEGSLATWIGSVMLLVCAFPAYSAAVVSRRQGGAWHFSVFMLILTGVAVFLSADEMVGIHEQIGNRAWFIQALVAGTFLDGFAWVILYLPLAIGFAVLTLIELRYFAAYVGGEAARRARRALLTMLGAITVALGMEVLEAWLYGNGMSREVSTLIEEAFEIVMVLGFYFFVTRINRAFN